jgi:hypothetical protein
MALATKILRESVKVGGYNYRIRALTVFQQLHVAAKLSTILMGFVTIKAADEGLTADRFGRALLAMSQNLTDDERQYVTVLCLSVIEREIGENRWQPIMAGDKFMFEDISLLESLELVYHVIDAHDMPSFFAAAPATGGGQTEG